MPLRRLRTTTPPVEISWSKSSPSCMAASVKAKEKPPSGGPQGQGAACGPLFSPCLIPRLVHQLVLLDPGHHRAQLLAHRLDRALRVQAAARLQRGGAGAVLDDEALGVLAGLDVLEHLLHHLLGFFG